MKINYTLNDDLTIKSWTAFPYSNELPTLHIENPEKININVDKVINGQLIKRDELVRETKEKAILIHNLETQILSCKQKLAESDYKLYKYLEGYLTEEEYLPIKIQR